MIAQGIRGADTLLAAFGARARLARPATLTVGLVFAASVVVLVRMLSIGLDEGTHPVRSRVGWQAWTIERLMDSSRTILFPLYSSSSRRSGSGCWEPRSAGMSRRRRCSSFPR